MSCSIRQALLLAAGIGCLGCGCATIPTASVSDSLPQKRPKLYRTQAGSQVTLQWDSTAGAQYSVIYTADLQDPNQWRVLPGYERITGRGGAQVLTFEAPQSGRLYYRLSPASSTSN